VGGNRPAAITRKEHPADEELAMSAIETKAPPLGALSQGDSASELSTLPASPEELGSRRPRRRVRLGGWRWVSPLVLLIVWQLTHVFKLISPDKLPPPSMVVSTAYNLAVHPTPAFGSLQTALLDSLERFAIGFAFGASIAILLALTAGLSRVGDLAIDPLAQMLRMLPLYGLVPMFIVWFGIGQLPKVILVALAAGVPLYLNLYAGIRSIDGRLYELGRVLKLSRREQLLSIVLPGALPQALVGLRLSLGTAWLALVVAEQVNASNGLGFMIDQAASFLRNDVIFVALAIYTLLGLLTDAIVRAIERRAIAWRTDLVAA
jgi:sulfonate transport system permease protein